MHGRAGVRVGVCPPKRQTYENVASELFGIRIQSSSIPTAAQRSVKVESDTR